MNRRLIERRPEGASEVLLADHAAVLDALAARFGMRFAEETEFSSVAAEI